MGGVVSVKMHQRTLVSQVDSLDQTIQSCCQEWLVSQILLWLVVVKSAFAAALSAALYVQGF